MRNQRVALGLVGVTLLAFCLRSIQLGSQALWTDEAYAYHVALRPTLAAVWADQDQTPPLFVMTLHVWMQAFGSDVWSVRLLPALAGAATVPVVQRLATRFVPARDAWLCAGLATLSVYQVIASQEARAFSMLVFFSVSSSLLMLRWTEQPTRLRLGAYACVAVLLAYTHVWGLFTLLAQSLWIWFCGHEPRARRRREWLVANLVVFLAFLFWMPAFLAATRRVAGNFWIAPPAYRDFYWTAAELSGAPPMTYLVGPMLLLAAWVAWKNRAWLRDSRHAFLWLWLGIPIVLPMVISLVLPIYAPRYAIACAIPAEILVVWALRQGLTRPRVFAVGAAVLLLAQGAALGVYLAGDRHLNPQQDWNGAIALVEAQALPNATLVFNKGYCDSESDRDLACSWEIAAERHDLELVPFFWENRGVTPEINESSVKQLDALVEDADDVWVVYSYPNDFDRLIEKRMEELGWVEVNAWNLKQIDLIRFSQPEVTAPAAPDSGLGAVANTRTPV